MTPEINKNPIVYIAAAIDHAGNAEDPFVTIRDLLSPWQSYNPKAAFDGPNIKRTEFDTQQAICRINFAAIDAADVMVVFSDLKKCSFGVPIEMMYGIYSGKTVILVLPSGIQSGPGVYSSMFSHASVILAPVGDEILSNFGDAFKDFISATHTQVQSSLRAYSGNDAYNARAKRNFVSMLFERSNW